MSQPRERFQSIHTKVAQFLPAAKRTARLNTPLPAAGRGAGGIGLHVVDLGCGVGGQCEFWADLGHTVSGLDIDGTLIAMAQRVAEQSKHDIDYRVGSAAAAPWPDASMDVCLLVELLEHVPDWQACLDECARLLRVGGVVFISTTNRLCPRQQEFELPLYSWYPQALKRRFERLAVTSRPDLVHGSPYPAVHWFTPTQLRRALEQRGFTVGDRFDMLSLDHRGVFVRALVTLVRAVPLLRFAAHVATPYCAVLGVKRG